MNDAQITIAVLVLFIVGVLAATLWAAQKLEQARARHLNEKDRELFSGAGAIGRMDGRSPEAEVRSLYRRDAA